MVYSSFESISAKSCHIIVALNCTNLRMQKTLLLLFLVMAALNGHAQDYKCTINRIASSDDSEPKEVAFRNKTFVGKEFTVERRTGLMAGVLKNSFITRPVVVDSGSTENSFKVVTTMSREQGLGSWL